MDNLSHNFPFMSSLDPYLLYPNGGGTSLTNPFFDYLLSGIVWVIGAGSPTQHTVDTIAPYFAPVLGALTVIPVYFIGRALGSRWAGLFGAGLVAILPGEFLGRSILGFTDHHVAETVLTATAVMFLLLALKNARKEKMTLEHLRHPVASSTARPLAYAALGGLFLGLYLASWSGALLFVFIVTAFLVLQFCLDHVRRVPTDYLGLVGVAAFMVALVVFLLLGQGGSTWLVLLMAVAIPAALFGLSRLMASGELNPFVYPAVVVGGGLACFGILWGADRSLMDTLVEHFSIFKWSTGTSVSEMIPLLYDVSATTGERQFSFGPLWKLFGYCNLFVLGGLVSMAYAVVRRWEAEKVLMLLWTLVILLATLAQRRFAYYLVVNIAVLAGYASWQLLQLAGLKEAEAAAAPQAQAAGKPQKPKGRKAPAQPSFQLRKVQVYPSLAALVMFCFFTIVPYVSVDLDGTGSRFIYMVQYSKATASITPENPRYAPPDAWCESLTWLRNNTPEPFGGADTYYDRYESPLDYSGWPDAYGVMAWWDYGYWIARIGHRPPVQNPGGAIPGVAAFFVAQDEAAGAGIMDTYGARYVILDYQFLTGKLYGAIQYSGGSENDYYEDFLYTSTSSGTATMQTARLYYPAYYRSMAVRLYMFGGQAVTPGDDDCWVVSWKWQTLEGVDYKVLTGYESFDTYEQAQAALAGKSPDSSALVGANPFISPVPLEKLEGFTPVHDSTITVAWSSSGATAPQVRIFEYLG